MNNEQRTNEIRQEITKLAEKYNFKKIIFLGQEEENLETKKLICRITIFPHQENKKIDIHDFGVFYDACLKVSNTLREISNHMAHHLLEKVLGNAIGSTTEINLHQGGKRAD